MDESKKASCKLCSLEFPSKTQLFRHLEEEHGLESATSKQCKVVLLVGWLAAPPCQNDEWVKEGTLTVTGYESDVEAIEKILFEAITATDDEFCSGQGSNPPTTDRLKGFSRCSSSIARSCYLLGVEEGCSRSCDTICYPGRRLQGENMKAIEAQWITAVNDKLPASIRVLMRYTLTSATADFHAECHFSQQVCSWIRCHELLPYAHHLRLTPILISSQPYYHHHHGLSRFSNTHCLSMR